jgi:hypothetical protein
MNDKRISRPTQLHALETFILRFVEDGQKLLDELLKLSEVRLSLSYMNGPRHSTEFHCECQFKMHASHVYARDNENASLENDLGQALKRWLEAQLWVPGESDVVADITVSDSKRAAAVCLSVDYLASVPRAANVRMANVAE